MSLWGRLARVLGERLPKTGLPKTEKLPKTGLPKTGLPKTGLPKTESEGGWTFELEYVDCGKPGCKKCPYGHGPYWYAYRKVGGRVEKRYIGRDLDKAAAKLV